MGRKRDVFIISCARTPIGKFGGALKDLKASELGAVAIKEVLQRSGNPMILGAVSEVIFGNVLQGGAGQNPARQAMLFGGLPNQCQALTIRKECASSLAAIDIAFSRIRALESEIIVAGGMESMSQAPYVLKRIFEQGQKNFGHREIDLTLLNRDLIDTMLWDGLQDVYQKNHPHMGNLVEAIAREYKVSRYDQDLFALLSFERALRIAAAGKFQKEIVPVVLDSKGEKIIFDKDEGVRETSFRKLDALKPAFGENGTITAGNASQLSDGAAALILASKEAAKKLGLKPMAKILSCASFSMAPAKFPLAPIGAIKKVLEKCGLNLFNIDFFEINEAFAPVPIIAARELGINLDKVNVRGGAIALGHPLAASGARITTTLLYILQDHKAKYGIACACNGGGEAVAVVIENLQMDKSS